MWRFEQSEEIGRSGVDVNLPDQNHLTALHYAAIHNRLYVIKYLISRDAKVDTADMKSGFSVLLWVVIDAAQRSSSTIWKFL